MKLADATISVFKKELELGSREEFEAPGFFVFFTVGFLLFLAPAEGSKAAGLIL